MKNRTNVDWSKHQLTIKKGSLCKIFTFKEPDTIDNAVNLVLVAGKTLITGDFGNWVFCREFEPQDTNENVSDGYWCEKLPIQSTDVYSIYSDYSPKDTKDSIQERLAMLDDSVSEEDLEEATSYYNDCLEVVSCQEFEYMEVARHYPSCLDCDDVILERKIKIHLQIIFDAFENMCDRISKGDFSKEVF